MAPSGNGGRSTRGSVITTARPTSSSAAEATTTCRTARARADSVAPTAGGTAFLVAAAPPVRSSSACSWFCAAGSLAEVSGFAFFLAAPRLVACVCDRRRHQSAAAAAVAAGTGSSTRLSVCESHYDFFFAFSCPENFAFFRKNR